MQTEWDQVVDPDDILSAIRVEVLNVPLDEAVPSSLALTIYPALVDLRR